MSTPAAPAPSRLVARLDAAIAAATDPIQRDCLSAERACCLARQGSLDEARAVVAEVQQRYARHPHAEISAWLSLTEGLISHFSDMGPLAHDKLKRSHALSVAANLGRIQALSAAWLAHSGYIRWDFVTMAKCLDSALRRSSGEDHSIRSRASLVMAQAYHFADRFDLALPWYQSARKHANADGDDSTVSAVMHNMAWLRASDLRQAKFKGTASESASRQAMLSAESIANFDRLIGAMSLDALVPVLRAQILSLQGDAAAALELYEEHGSAAQSQGLIHLESWFLANRAWCHANLGMLDKAKADVDLCLARLGGFVQGDDRAATHSRLAEVYLLLGDPLLSEQHKVIATDLWTSLAKTQSEIVSLLSKIGGPDRWDIDNKKPGV